MKPQNDKKGQGMIEYLMIAAFVVAIALLLNHVLRPTATTAVGHISDAIANTGN